MTQPRSLFSSFVPTVFGLLLALAPSAATQASDEAPLRYGRVGKVETPIRNLPDAQSNEVLRAPGGTLLAIYREVGDWLEVEVPGGFAVWVFGQYVQPTTVPDVMEVTGNGVNLRPRAKRDVESYPLRQKLFAGDRVRVIERLDPEGPLDEDWVHIWSPAGVRAWIKRSDSVELERGENGAALWKAALAKLAAKPARKDADAKPSGTAGGATPKTQPAAAKSAPRDPFEAALESARTQLEAERAKNSPNWDAVVSAFDKAKRLAPTGADAIQAQSGIDAVAALREASVLRSELESERQRREQELVRRQEEVWERSRSKDPLGDVFLSRGALEREVDVEGRSRFFLRFGGEVVSELVCVSGRYDLDLFSGYHVGVKGMDLGVTPSDGGLDGLSQIEVTKIEVLARR